MTVHKGTMDVLNRVFSSNTLTWEPQSTGGSGGPGGGSTQVSIREILTSSGASVMDSTANAINVNVVAGSAAGDTTATVTPAAGSTWRSQPGSTLWASSAGFHFNSSGALVIDQGSTVFAVQVAAPVIVRSSAADALGTVYQSTFADLRATVHNSTIGDLLASVQQNSSVWQVQPGSTAFVKTMGISVDSSNVQNVKMDGSTALTIGSISATAGRLNIGSTAADNAALVTQASTAWQVQLSSGSTVQAMRERCSTYTSSNSTQSSTSFTMLNGNAARLGFTCFNAPTQGATLYLKWGATASTTSFNVVLPPNAYYEMPSPVYTGRIDAIWDSTGVGRGAVTEWLI